MKNGPLRILRFPRSLRPLHLCAALLSGGTALPLLAQSGATASAVVNPAVAAPAAANTAGEDTAGSDTRPAASLGVARALDAVLARALSLRGTRYRKGGTSPDAGFDCSGYVGYLYRDIVGFQLPRSAQDIWRFGKTVERSELQPGDLVFYNTMKRPYSHVGIYLGGNQFVHAPASGGSVRVVNMDERYWATRWNGAKRVAQ